MLATYTSIDRAWKFSLAALAGCLLWSQAALAQRNTTEVSGTLGDFNQKAVLVKTNGGDQVVKVDNNTRVSIRAPATDELLVPGALVELSGDATSANTIEDAGITVIISGRPPVWTNGGTYYMRRAESNERIPIVLVGFVVDTEPLQVRGHNSIRSEYYFSKDVGPDNVINRTYTFPTANKVFQVKPPARGEGKFNVWADLGNAIQLAGVDARVLAYVSNTTGIATEITIDREKPLEPEELGVTGKKSKRGAKKPIVKKKIVKKTTSSKRSKKTDKDADAKVDSETKSDDAKKKAEDDE